MFVCVATPYKNLHVEFVLISQGQLVQLEHGAKTDCLDPRDHKVHEDRKARLESLVPQDSLVIEERPDLLVSTVSVKYNHVMIDACMFCDVTWV